MNESFKVTVEYICENMIDSDVLHSYYNGNAKQALKDITDDFKESIECMSSKKTVKKVEVIKNP